MIIRAPMPYFGGKLKIAATVWRRFGDAKNYVEPFCGSCAVLLSRPHWPWKENDDNRTETVNDADGFLCNVWRALQAAPDEVAEWCDYPVSELDLYARHYWLVNEARGQVEKLREDPAWFDAKIAGWWLWGACQWIGSGWCSHPEWEQRPHLGNAGRGVHRPSQKRPHLGNAGRGVHRPSQKRPHLGNAGRGVHRPSQQLPHLGDAGMGVHRPSQKRPHLGNAGMGVHRPSQKRPHLGDAGKGECARRTLQLREYFGLISDRLRGVRVCCGDWSRVCGPTPTVKQGLTAVFIDPPYSEHAGRDERLYARDDLHLRDEVQAWCREWQDDPRMRIALCGYDGEYDLPGWECAAWKARGGYGSQGNGQARENSHRERIWFSPHCLKPTNGAKQRGLFEESET